MATARFIRASSQENISTTLSAAATLGDNTIAVNDASQLVAPIYLVIDRVDASGTLKATTAWEYVLVTSISVNNLTVTRGLGGSTAQAHSSGAVIEAIVSAAGWEDQRAALVAEHDSAGLHVIATATIGLANFVSGATIPGLYLTSRIDVSTASITGLGLTPVWVIPGNTSSASTGIGKPLIMPRAGQFRAFVMTVQSQVSGASLTIQVNKNNVAIFDTVGRPFILSTGTFASTASIKTPGYIAGDSYTVDLATGGNYFNLTVQGISF